MSGRGRGRGRGRGGFGSVKLGANSIEIPESMDIQCHEILLFPLHTSKPYKVPNRDEIDLYYASDSFLQRIKASPYHSVPKRPAPEVEQYSDKYLKESEKPAFRSEIAKIQINLDFFPDELHSVASSKKRKLATIDKQEIDLSKLEELEKEELVDKSSMPIGAKDEGDEESGGEIDEAEELDSDMDDDNDYAIDHYDDDLDALGSDGGDGGDY